MNLLLKSCKASSYQFFTTDQYNNETSNKFLNTCTFFSSIIIKSISSFDNVSCATAVNTDKTWVKTRFNLRWHRPHTTHGAQYLPPQIVSCSSRRKRALIAPPVIAVDGLSWIPGFRIMAAFRRQFASWGSLQWRGKTTFVVSLCGGKDCLEWLRMEEYNL